MVIHVSDPKTDALVRAFARQRGIGITQAVREVVEKALEQDRIRAAAASAEKQPALKPVAKT
jgi:hypothetical protein